MLAKHIAILAPAAALLPVTAAAAQGGYNETAVENGGSIVGVVHYDGPKPAAERVDVTTKEDVCHAEPIFSQKLVVSDDGLVQWAVLSLDGVTEGKPFPTPEDTEDRPTLDQQGCVFHPHVAVVPQGQPLRILNSDGILHNVHTWPKKNRSKNIAMPGVIKETKLRFRRSEHIRVSCDIHPWMEAYIVVAEHPYYAVSDEEGAFTLSDVPPGTYTLALWHETLGQVKKTVTVEAGKEAAVEFTLSPEGQ